MAAAKQPRIETIYQIKITLKDIQPPIWRRFQVPGRISLNKLHRIIQILMPWDDYHLHQFIIDGIDYGEPDPEEDISELKDDRYARLNELVLAAPAKFIYEYDFGDGWKHEILVEKILPPKEGVCYPVCLAGKRTCPPEDCGGTDGYVELLEAIRNPAHEEHDRLLEWVGGSFDPEAFDLEGINVALKRIK